MGTYLFYNINLWLVEKKQVKDNEINDSTRIRRKNE